MEGKCWVCWGLGEEIYNRMGQLRRRRTIWKESNHRGRVEVWAIKGWGVVRGSSKVTTEVVVKKPVYPPLWIRSPIMARGISFLIFQELGGWERVLEWIVASSSSCRFRISIQVDSRRGRLAIFRIQVGLVCRMTASPTYPAVATASASWPPQTKEEIIDL